MGSPVTKRSRQQNVTRSGRYFTSNRRADDHAPATPEASIARTLHHMRVVGSVLVEKVDAVTVWLTIGEAKVLSSSIWMT